MDQSADLSSCRPPLGIRAWNSLCHKLRDSNPPGVIESTWSIRRAVAIKATVSFQVTCHGPPFTFPSVIRFRVTGIRPRLSEELRSNNRALDAALSEEPAQYCQSSLARTMTDGKYLSRAILSAPHLMTGGAQGRTMQDDYPRVAQCIRSEPANGPARFTGNSCMMTPAHENGL